MPQLNGVQFMQLLQNRAQVIITSAYQEYAIDGFEHNVIDYLLKPISFERFYKGVEKAYNQKNPTQKLNRSQEMLPETGGYIFVKVETKMVRVELDDILYIEGLKNYVSIYTKTQRIVTLAGDETTGRSIISQTFCAGSQILYRRFRQDHFH
jgi:DNA-binding LytR/AlgR family response regulator